jgi:hypothetical protein
VPAKVRDPSKNLPGSGRCALYAGGGLTRRAQDCDDLGLLCGVGVEPIEVLDATLAADLVRFNEQVRLP